MSKVKKVELKERFETCPECGYENGFHIILINASKPSASQVKFQLKCPSCAQTYDLNLYCTIKRQQ
jgi:hypothetical protein